MVFGRAAMGSQLWGMERCDIPTEVDEERVRAVLPTVAPRDRLLIELGWETGLRISELLSLKVGQVLLDGHPVSVLRVRRASLKNGRGVRARSVPGRVIPLNDRARAAIGECLTPEQIADPVSPVFLSRQGDRSPLTRRQATRVIKKIFLDAGLDPCRIWGTHTLRKRYVRRVYDLSGHDINLTRAAVSHRYISTTQAYLGLDEVEAEGVILRLGVQTNAAAIAGARDAIADPTPPSRHEFPGFAAMV